MQKSGRTLQMSVKNNDYHKQIKITHYNNDSKFYLINKLSIVGLVRSAL